MLSPRRRIALAAALGVALLGAIGIHAGPTSAGALQARLQAAAEQALESAGADWASVELHGQRAVLSGMAPGQDARERAVQAVKSAAWAGGVVAGGVTTVEDETRLAAAPDGAMLRADLSGGYLTLSGFAPDAATRDSLAFAAERRFPNRALVELRLAPGAAPAGFEAAAALILDSLARMENGAGLLRGERFVVYGLTSNSQTAASVRAALGEAPGAFEAAALVREPGARFETTMEDETLCALAAEAAFGPRPAAFLPNAAAPDAGTIPGLRRAGETVARCSDVTIAVSASAIEAEAEGGAPARARAAIGYMTDAGAAPDQLVASDEPAGAFGIAFDPAPEPGAGDTDEAEGEPSPDPAVEADDTDPS